MLFIYVKFCWKLSKFAIHPSSSLDVEIKDMVKVVSNNLSCLISVFHTAITTDWVIVSILRHVYQEIVCNLFKKYWVLVLLVHQDSRSTKNSADFFMAFTWLLYLVKPWPSSSKTIYSTSIPLS